MRESNAEISRRPRPIWLTVDLRGAIQAAKNELEMERKKNVELADLLHEKTKQCAKTQVRNQKSSLIQTLYDKLKRRVMINPLQNAAQQSVDMQTIVFHRSATTNSRLTIRAPINHLSTIRSDIRISRLKDSNFIRVCSLDLPFN